jgi:hypothetical protein
MQPRRISRRRGRGTFRRWWWELERPSLALWSADITGETALYNRLMVGSEGRAGRASDAAILPLEPDGQNNRGRGKGRCFTHVSAGREGRVIA